MSSAGVETVNVTASRPLETLAGPECYVDVYPFEGGQFTLSNGNLLNLTMSKALKQDAGGFAFTLAPDFVAANSAVSWPQVITPMSTVVISMRRGTLQNVVMVGIVTTVVNSETWTGSTVARTFTIMGADFGYFMSMDDYYTLWMLAAFNNDISVIAAGFQQGTPDALGKYWYNNIIFGNGIFKNTKVQFNAGPLSLFSTMALRFDAFDILIPYGDYFISSNGPWASKFKQIFPFPYYEFFTTTTFGETYSGLSGGTQFFGKTLGQNVTATPALVARLNPLPKLQASPDSAGLPQVTGIDVSLWNQLSQSDLRGVGYIESHVSFSEASVFNFYAINPSWAFGQNGGGNFNITVPLINFSVVIDQASMAKYGYRPFQMNISWLSDINGAFAIQQGGNAKQAQQKVLALLFMQLAGYYEATPLMAMAQVRTQLRPDIAPGTKFVYTPFHDNKEWTFYIEAISHEYTFGGACTTNLTLSRGLPTDVYNDTTLLKNIHTGNAQRLDGVYQSGLPANSPASLQALSPDAFGQLIRSTTQAYITPQWTKQQ